MAERKAYKLLDIYNTKFFYLSYKKDLQYLCSTILNLEKGQVDDPHAGCDLMKNLFDDVKAGRAVSIDCADIVFSADLSSLISYFEGEGIYFIDSADEWRNKLFENNRSNLKYRGYKTMVLPMPDKDQPLTEYLKYLGSDIPYELPINPSDILWPLIYVISARRPSVKIMMGRFAAEFFEYVSRAFTIKNLEFYSNYEYSRKNKRTGIVVTKKFNEFYFSTKEGIEVINFNDAYITNSMGMVEGAAYIQQLGQNGTITDAVSVGRLVPTILGKVPVYDLPIFDKLFTRSVKYIQNSLSDEIKPTLDKYLTEQGLKQLD